jgi:hypothetical protein
VLRLSAPHSRRVPYRRAVLTFCSVNLFSCQSHACLCRTVSCCVSLASPLCVRLAVLAHRLRSRCFNPASRCSVRNTRGFLSAAGWMATPVRVRYTRQQLLGFASSKASLARPKNLPSECARYSSPLFCSPLLPPPPPTPLSSGGSHRHCHLHRTTRCEHARGALVTVCVNRPTREVGQRENSDRGIGQRNDSDRGSAQGNAERGIRGKDAKLASIVTPKHATIELCMNAVVHT